MLKTALSLSALVLCSNLECIFGFIVGTNSPRVLSQRTTTCTSRDLPYHSAPLFTKNDDQEDNSVKGSADDDEDVPIIAQSTVKIDDGGSDLTNRFKFKVNALMGNFDPSQADTDNERTDGNILNAMLKFPTSYVFNTVGKTKGDPALEEQYVKKVEDIVGSSTGDDIIESVVKPRGKNYTKITVEVMVESSSMITDVYDQLASLEETVMRF